jgi:ssDNA-binding Zn-finger/Zn-ribbon topoisomerase 1
MLIGEEVAVESGKAFAVPDTCVREVRCPRCNGTVVYLYTVGVERDFIWNRDCPNCRIRVADPVPTPRPHVPTFEFTNNGKK